MYVAARREEKGLVLTPAISIAECYSCGVCVVRIVICKRVITLCCGIWY